MLKILIKKVIIFVPAAGIKYKDVIYYPDYVERRAEFVCHPGKRS